MDNFTEEEIEKIYAIKRKTKRELRYRKTICKDSEQLTNLRDQLNLRSKEIQQLTNDELSINLLLLATLLAYNEIIDEIDQLIALRERVDVDLLMDILHP